MLHPAIAALYASQAAPVAEEVTEVYDVTEFATAHDWVEGRGKRGGLIARSKSSGRILYGARARAVLSRTRRRGGGGSIANSKSGFNPFATTGKPSMTASKAKGVTRSRAKPAPTPTAKETVKKVLDDTPDKPLSGKKIRTEDSRKERLTPGRDKRKVPLTPKRGTTPPAGKEKKMHPQATIRPDAALEAEMSKENRPDLYRYTAPRKPAELLAMHDLLAEFIRQSGLPFEDRTKFSRGSKSWAATADGLEASISPSLGLALYRNGMDVSDTHELKGLIAALHARQSKPGDSGGYSPEEMQNLGVTRRQLEHHDLDWNHRPFKSSEVDA